MSAPHRPAAEIPTFETFAASIGATIDDLREWAKEKPEFRASLEVANAKRKDLIHTEMLAGNLGVMQGNAMLAERPFWEE